MTKRYYIVTAKGQFAGGAKFDNVREFSTYAKACKYARLYIESGHVTLSVGYGVMEN